MIISIRAWLRFNMKQGNDHGIFRAPSAPLRFFPRSAPGKVSNIYTSSPANCPSAILIDRQKVTPQMPLLITNRSHPSFGVKEISFIILMRLSLALPSSNKLFIFHGQSYNSLFKARTLAAMTLAFLTYNTLWLCHSKSPSSCLK